MVCGTPSSYTHEVVAGEVADEPAVGVRNRRRDAHHLDARPEAGLLVLLPQQDGRGEEDKRGDPGAGQAASRRTR